MEASMERAEGRKPGTQSVERTRGLRQPAAGKDKLGQRTAPGEEGCSAWRDQEFPEPASNRPQLPLGAVGLRQSCVSSTVGRTHTPTHPHTCLGKTKGRSLGPVGAVGSLFCSGPSSRADVLLAGCPLGVHVPSSGLLCRSGNRQGVMADHICLSVCLSVAPFPQQARPLIGNQRACIQCATEASLDSSRRCHAHWDLFLAPRLARSACPGSLRQCRRRVNQRRSPSSAPPPANYTGDPPSSCVSPLPPLRSPGLGVVHV